MSEKIKWTRTSCHEEKNLKYQNKTRFAIFKAVNRKAEFDLKLLKFCTFIAKTVAKSVKQEMSHHHEPC